MPTAFDAAGIAWSRRLGTFEALDHDSDGYMVDGAPSAAARQNEIIFKRRWPAPIKAAAKPLAGAETLADGLHSLRFRVLKREPLPAIADARAASWLRVVVRID
jgi:hypothetical protein